MIATLSSSEPPVSTQSATFAVGSRPHVPYDELPYIEAKGTSYEPDYEPYYESDLEEAARERELLMDDIASDNDDFARSNEDGWYYSDED